MKLFPLILLVLFSGCSMLSPLQKAKFITVNNLLETAKYSEAKVVIDEMTEDEETSKWPRTWYMKGLLCHIAYQEGVKKNDMGLMELYPNQLFLAFESYEKSRTLDKAGKIEKQLVPRYIMLANDFQSLGEKNFSGKKYTDALNAFEHSLIVTRSNILEVKLDTNLIFNLALAAYESKNFTKAIEHLLMLHSNNYSQNATHLLYQANLEKGDTLAGKKVLLEGINKYNSNEDLVLLLTDILFKTKEINEALTVLDMVITRKPTNATFYNTKGLVYQKTDRFQEAIDSYSEAVKHKPDDPHIYINIATCYYNIGVDIEEKTRTLTNNRLVAEEKAKSVKAFEIADSWLDKIPQNAIIDQATSSKIYELYKLMKKSDKAKNFENQNR
jgi:tetratricopeptide (TPR) repeat protein